MMRLFQSENLKGIVLTESNHTSNQHVVDFASSNTIPLFRANKSNVTDELVKWILGLSPDIGICLTFPFKIPKQVIDAHTNGICNFHFGALPDNAGAAPLFWTLSTADPTAVLTVHEMTTDFDSGHQILRKQLSIYPGENQGLLGARLGQLASESIDELFLKIENGITSDTTSVPTKLRKRPTIDDLTINWSEQDSMQIEALVNATNPTYGGAITYFKNSMVKVLEVSPAQVNNASLLGPGTIVHASAQEGIFVLCADYRFLRINVLETPECILTGGKLAALGIKAGDKFGKHEAVAPATSKLII